MKYSFYLLTIFLLISISCEKPINGYYQTKFKKANFTTHRNDIIRIHGDSIFGYYLTGGGEVDSTVYVWDEKNSTYYSNKEGENYWYPYGNIPVERIDENSVLFMLDTIGFHDRYMGRNASEKDKSKYKINVEILKSTYKDTFTKITQSEFRKYFEIEQEIYLKSLKEPYVNEFEVQDAIKNYVDFYLENNEKFVENSIKINRISDDAFHFKFDVIKGDNNQFSWKDTYYFSIDYEKDIIGRLKYSLKKIN